jgi:CubicO group peptidase (beta-lactamase class C family)
MSTLFRWVDSSRVVGIAVARIEPTRQGAGVAGFRRSLEPNRLQVGSVMEIGSITKGFTGILLADLVLRGVVSLDDPVARHLPAGWVVPSFEGHQVTLRDLATHTSGFPRMPARFAPADLGDPYAAMNDDSLRVHVAASPPTRAPGRYEYSNLGMALLGRALAHAGGKSWEALVRERVLEPLRLRNTWAAPPPAVEELMSSGHSGSFIPVPRWHFDAYAPAGALVSTIMDLAAMIEALARPDTTAPIGRAIRLATTAQRPISGGRDSVALGWHIQYAGDTRVLWHNGGTGGFRSWLGVVQGERRGVAVLNNAVLGWTDALGASLLLGRPLPEPPHVTRISVMELPAAALEELVGRYPLQPTLVVDITREDTRLFAQVTGQPRVHLVATAADRFIAPSVPGAELRFQRDTTGRIIAVELHQNGSIQRGARAP